MNAVPAEISALVTGASSGIGEQFARRLAARGHDLILVARRGQRMRRLAAELEESHRVSVSVLVADLSTATGRDAVVGPLRSRSPWLLINNAGFGTMGRFVEIDPKRANEMVAVNALAVHELTLAVLPGNVSAGGGGILNVASTAALQPLPYFATYAATKAFVLHLSEALAVEVRGTGTRVMALCPGPVATEFGDVSGSDRLGAVAQRSAMSAVRCVDIALRAFDRGDAVCVPGVLNVGGAIAVRMLPRAVVRRAVGIGVEVLQRRGRPSSG